MIRARGGRLRHLAALLLVGLAPAACDTPPSGFQSSELEAMIDSLLPRIAAVSGLEVRRPVRFALQPKAEVRAFIEEQLEEELGPEELLGMQRAYQAFGLLPDTLDLRSLLLELYTEQVVGYYDPRTDRLYVVEGVHRDDAAPVVAHELVHALQDQRVDLDSLVARDRGNDRQLAAQAAAEGQATLVMIVLQAEETTGQTVDPASLPDLTDFLRPALESENAQFPVFQGAPRIIRETMLFPYLAGAAFVQALYREPSVPNPPVPFERLLPQSTEQVLDPQRRFLEARDAPTEIRVDDSAPGWRLVYGNTLGQLETSILLAEHLDTDAASAAEGWDGDRFVLLEGPGGAEALVWYSVWDDDAGADRFAAAYERVLESRPGREGRVTREQVQGRAVVRVVEVPAGNEAGDVAIPGIRSLGEQPRL